MTEQKQYVRDLLKKYKAINNEIALFEFDAEGAEQSDFGQPPEPTGEMPLCEELMQEAAELHRMRMARKGTIDYMRNEMLRLSRAISNLSLTKRMVITMRYVQGMTVKDISSKMCCTASSVYWSLNRALDELAEMF